MSSPSQTDAAANGASAGKSPRPDPIHLTWQKSWRAIRLGFAYPRQLVGSILLACLAAACWGGNIAAVWPVLQVSLQRQSMQDWSSQRIEDSQRRVADLRGQIQQLEQGIAPPVKAGQPVPDLGLLEDQLESEQNALKATEKLHPFIVKYMPRDPFQTVLLIMGAILGITLIKNLCVIGSMVLTARVTLDIVRDLRKTFFDTILRTDIESFTKKGTSQLWTRFVQDIPYLSFALTAIYGRAIGEPLKILACLVLAAWWNWQLLVFSMIVTPIALLLISGLNRKMKSYTLNGYEQDASTNTLVFEVMQGLSTVQSYTMEPAERVRFAESAQKCWHIGLRMVLFRAMSKPVVELLGIIFVCTGVLAGAHLVLHRETHLFGLRISDRPLEPAGLLIFFGALVGMYDPLRKIGEVLPQIMMGLASAERLFAVLDASPKITEPARPRRLSQPHGELVFENVHFQYNAIKPVLQGVNLTIPRGEAIAIVGPNGCGKSTLANLIPRFFDPKSGRVRLDDVDLRDAGLLDLRHRIGLVTQQSHLFDDTVRSNICYGTPDATDAEIIAAAEQAHAHEFIIKQLAQGYDTMVGHGGCRLSGGQRQRIALARAILRNPEILILDEPTSQIDMQSEKLIQDTLQHFMTGRTTVMITHRLSLLALARRIVVMQQGKIIAVGQHDELLSHCHLYRRLHQLDQKAPAQAPQKAA